MDAHGEPYGWAGVQSLPRAVTLASDGVTVLTNPIPELQGLATLVLSNTSVVVPAGQTLTLLTGVEGGIGSQVQIVVTMNPASAAQVSV